MWQLRRYARIPLREVRRLAIDEIHLGKKAKFLTLVIDLDTGRILWVAKGRGGDALRKFWRRLRLARARVEAVACDMSAAYWSAILEHLPGAAVVFDHFHIIKLANEKIDDLRRALQREAEVLGYQTLKGSRFRGLAAAAKGLDRASADYMGMLATVMNALAMQNALERGRAYPRPVGHPDGDGVRTLYPPPRRAPYEQGPGSDLRRRHRQPYFTTDTRAALRAAEMGCDALFKGTSVDGVYDSRSQDRIPPPSATNGSALRHGAGR